MNTHTIATKAKLSLINIATAKKSIMIIKLTNPCSCDCVFQVSATSLSWPAVTKVTAAVTTRVTKGSV